MLCVNHYPQKYINDCRRRVAAQVSAYQALSAATQDKTSAAALGALAPHFFANMVLSLECYFVYRARGAEGKNGNPLNEVRMLCNSIISNKNILAADKTMKYVPEKSVLKIKIGDEIRISEEEFNTLSTAFFREIESEYL